jgi:hypothetical protein
MLWHRMAALAAPLLLAAPVFAQLDAEACFRLYYGARPTRDLTRARACFEKEVPQRTYNETPFHLGRQDRRRYAATPPVGWGGYMYMPPLTASTWPVM